MESIDIGDIARGRRLTAVTASELELIPRKSTRPSKPGMLFRARRRVMMLMLRVGRQVQGLTVRRDT